MPQVTKQLGPMTPTYPSPRPTPKFFDNAQSYSTKKMRQTPKSRCPPRPPIKSCPPISRLFPHKYQQQMRARAVSFVNPHATLRSPHYDENSPELYFDQVFHIVCKLGAGSFGDVFKVKSKDNQQYYAVKRSRERYKGSLDRQRKLEEVRRHEELPHHDNCVRFIRAWEERQHLYIQTELCEMSLNQFAELNHDIPESLVWKYLLDLIQAVKHLHDHEVLHLDIKPANIFVTESHQVCKLGDFGLAAVSSQLSDPTEGDPKYLAPELMEGVFTKAADIFSLGITILELATDLDLPLGGPRWHDLRRGDIPHLFLHKLSQDLVDLIRAMMHPEPSQRPTAAQVLAKASLHIVASSTLLCSWLSVILWSLMLVFLYPLKRWLLRPPPPPPPSSSWDTSFSDDEDEAVAMPIRLRTTSTPLRSQPPPSPLDSWETSRLSGCKRGRGDYSGSPLLAPKLRNSFDDEDMDSAALDIIGPRNLMTLFDAEANNSFDTSDN